MCIRDRAGAGAGKDCGRHSFPGDQPDALLSGYEPVQGIVQRPFRNHHGKHGQYRVPRRPEASTLKDISENWLGKATISMQTEGRSRGQSESYRDVYKRQILHSTYLLGKESYISD